jgi:pyruvate dehydrogenase E1 component alpha subunit
VVATFFGDGGLNQGVLLEALNLAALWQLPVIFVCENNGYATTMPVRTGVAGTATGRAEAFGIPGATVDGMDVETVREAAAEAVARARRGDGPSLLECMTYRFGPHHTMEFGIRLNYRTKEEIDEWRERDPLIIEGGRITPAERDSADAEVVEVLAEAERFALASPRPDPAGALDYLYASGLVARAGVA